MTDTVPVLWVSRVAGVLARGYADQGLLEAVMARDVWTPPGALTFDHRLVVESDFPDDVDGAIVVISPRHHVEDAPWLNEQIQRLDWSVLILCSDEEWAFPWWKMHRDDRHKLWISQPRPEHSSADFLFPCGWYPQTRELLAETSEPGQARDLLWFFAGQVTHIRRWLMEEALAQSSLDGDVGVFAKTDGYMQEAIPRRFYFENMAKARTVPCPSGPQSTCTARTEEALEAGCVPVCDLVKPEDPQFDYWGLVFGEGYPWPAIYDWLTFAEVARAVDWPRDAVRCWSFWQGWKRRMARKLDADVHAARGTERRLDVVSDLVSVIVTTSPAPLHPSTDHLEQTIDSIREALPNAEVFVMADGVRPEQEDRRADYEEYLHRVCWLTNFRWHNVVPVVSDEWVHQANLVRAGLERIDTPLVLFMEHDTPLVGPVDWGPLSQMLLDGVANYVRFHPETHVHDEHEPNMLTVADLADEVVARLRPTKTWWARPNLARADFWRDRVLPYFPAGSRTFVEDPLYGIVLDDFARRGDAAWWDWRLFMYDPDPDEVPHLGIKRSWHLDSRGADPKYSIWLHEPEDGLGRGNG
jgi:hypothetical protein